MVLSELDINIFYDKLVADSAVLLVKMNTCNDFEMKNIAKLINTNNQLINNVIKYRKILKDLKNI